MSIPLLTVLLAACPCIAGSRILFLPFPMLSVVNQMAYISDELAERNHQVYMLLPQLYPSVNHLIKDRPYLNIISYDNKYPDLLSEASIDPTALFDIFVNQKVIDFRYNSDALYGLCKNVLEDKNMEHKVKELQFDLVIVSGASEERCYFLLPYRLGLPYVSLTTEIEPWVTRNPSLPSFVPVQHQYPYLTPSMNFWERVKNFKESIAWVFYVDQLPMAADSLLATYVPDKPALTMNQVAGLSLLWLIDNDVVIDYPRPMMPNEVNIGGLSVMAPKPLPDDLEKFMSSAKAGVIVANFGSISLVPEYIMMRIVEGVKKVPNDYHIIIRWHLKTEKPEMPANVLFIGFIPQHDILAHPNTKLFLTHSGANGQFEALACGVPMINFPVWYDQPYNAKRADYHGFSETIDLLTFTAEDLFKTIHKVLTNDSYTNKISVASEIFNSRTMTPRQRAAFWVDHVIQYGGQHLRSRALDMPAWEYLMLDVVACFLLVLFLAGLWMAYIVLRISKRLLGL